MTNYNIVALFSFQQYTQIYHKAAYLCTPFDCHGLFHGIRIMTSIQVMRNFHKCKVQTDKIHFEGNSSASRGFPRQAEWLSRGTQFLLHDRTPTIDSFSLDFNKNWLNAKC